jgi:hypothetical protein
MKRVASILVFALLMAARDEFDNRYVRMLIAAAAGASLAPLWIKSKIDRESVPHAGRTLRNRGPLWIAVALYSVSWFLPVIKYGERLGNGPPGWEALQVVLSPLWRPESIIEEPWFALLSVASGLTNVFMLVALFRQIRGHDPSLRSWTWLAWIAVAIDASWMGVDLKDQDLRIGYYLWFFSFVFLAVSFLVNDARQGSPKAQPATA